jgi:4-amino-4-deoxy-L-arabinose transferase-like glycosyltransferase
MPKVRLELLALLVIGFLVLAAGINESPLTNWDEATYAEVVHESLSSGSYLHFTWNGEAYLKKPPALFWMVGASFRLFGESAWAARLPSVLMGLGTLLIIYLSAAAVAGRLGGLFAGMIPLGFYFFVARGGRECATDAPLIFFSTLGIFAFIRARTDRRWIPIAGAACGIAILSKGLAGVIPLIVASFSVLALPGFAAIGISGLILQVTIAAAVAAPWFMYEAVTNGALFWSTFVKQETLLRVASHLEDHRHRYGYTPRILLREVVHLWPLLLPLAGLSVAAFRRGALRTLRRLPVPLMVWLLWFALAFGAACAVQTKLGWYVLPALIPVALICGCVLAGAFVQTDAERHYCMPLGALAVAILIGGAPHRWGQIQQSFQTQRDRSRPSYAMAMQARAVAMIRGAGELYFAGTTLPTLVYHSGMRCHFVSPAEPEFELTDLGGNPVSVLYHELVLRQDNGDLLAIANFDEEWNRSGPEMERGQASITPE